MNYGLLKWSRREYYLCKHTFNTIPLNSIKYLCSKKNKVSSHFLISKKGEIYSLVSEKKEHGMLGNHIGKGKKI